jgi:hypothetical protein
LRNFDLSEYRSSLMADTESSQQQQSGAFLQALGAEFSMLQGARGATISESSSRSSLYMTTLSGAVVALALVAQASRFGATFFIFALAVMPVVFFLGVTTYYRLLQTGVEDVVYARAISKIRDQFSKIDPSQAAFFHASAVDQVGLRNLGLWRLRWQQFLSAAATVAIVNSVVGGVFLALVVTYLVAPPVLASIGTGALGALILATVFLVHQWKTWMRVAAAMPMAESGARPTR